MVWLSVVFHLRKADACSLFEVKKLLKKNLERVDIFFMMTAYDVMNKRKYMVTSC